MEDQIENKISSLFNKWNNSLLTEDPKEVIKLYTKDAILLPTLSNQVRHNHEEIEDYFVKFLSKSTQGKIDEANIRINDNIAINSGMYTFSFSDASTAQARFTFVYKLVNNEWLIIEHHSSHLPE